MTQNIASDGYLSNSKMIKP